MNVTILTSANKSLIPSTAQQFFYFKQSKSNHNKLNQTQNHNSLHICNIQHNSTTNPISSCKTFTYLILEVIDCYHTIVAKNVRNREEFLSLDLAVTAAV